MQPYFKNVNVNQEGVTVSCNRKMTNGLPMNVMRRNDDPNCTHARYQKIYMTRILIFIIFLLNGNHCPAQGLFVYNPTLAQNFDRFLNKTFPAMELETTDSTFFNTAQLAGKTVYVDFWFTTCPPCIKEMPYAQALQTYFEGDTNVVFLNICIENIERKAAWKQMVQERSLKGIHVFYARNRPQKVNLLRQLGINNFPMYLLVNDNKIIGYNAPSPSEKGFVHWAIYKASHNVPLSQAYTSMAKNSKESRDYLVNNQPGIYAASPLT